MFKQADDVKDEFTVYEHFLYNDNQNYSTASAPGLGGNLAGVNFNNNLNKGESPTNLFNTIKNSEGFDIVYHKSSSNGVNLHLFTDVYNTEQPPFYNTNRDVYLSFIARGFTGSFEPEDASPNSGFDLHISGGDANISFGSSNYKNYDYGRTRKIPFDAYKSASSFDFSRILNPTSTGSHYKRYIFKGKQNYWRPSRDGEGEIIGDVFNLDLANHNLYWSGSNRSYFEVLSSSKQVISASTSGSIGDGYAYGIKDSSGQHTPYLFPNYVDKNNLGQTFTFNTASILPQGDLFPILSPVQSTVFFTDMVVSYNNPTDVHPFSTIYRPSSGSYAGSSKWNSWYDGLLTSASQYDNDNIHSLVNNLPLFLRQGSNHEVLRKFVYMLGEQFDLIRNYIDNYHNFYKLGYKNPESMPDNLLPILGDSLGWKILSPHSGSSLNDYVSSNLGGGGGVQAAINLTWKKILNNLIYVYKAKGTTEAIKSLLNLYGFDGSAFRMREYGGSIADHNPTIITNDSADFLEGMKNIKGNVSFVEERAPFLMLNIKSGSNYLALDWWANDAKPNGIEFLFNSEKTATAQTILRSSGSNDLWDLRLVPSASSNTVSKLEFRINYSASSAIGTNHISMSTAYNDQFKTGNIWNVLLQRNVVTASNTLVDSAFTQSYHMFVARKDDDKIKNVSFISMSSHDSSISASYKSGSNINQNFITASSMTSTGKNLLMGESLSGSIAEIRAWENYVSMSKFKQHVINYQSVVGNKISSSVAEVIYRFKLDEGIPDWSQASNSASLKIYDSNPNKIKDYSHFISTQPKPNFRSTTTEQTFYKLAVKGTDRLPNDNQTNLAPKLTSVGQLNPDLDIVSEPKDSTGKLERVYSNRFGRDMSYVNTIDSIIMNMLPDFRIDDFIGDPDEDLTETYQDLLKLRKSIIQDSNISVNIVDNQRSIENLVNNSIVENLEILTPARTKFEFSYEVKNDALFRSKMKRSKLTGSLNPNFVIGSTSAQEWNQPTLSSSANENFKSSNISMFSSSYKIVSISSSANENFKSANISMFSSSYKIVSASGAQHNIFKGATAIKYVNLASSSRELVYSVTPKVGGGYDMTRVFLGWKNDIAKNFGTSSNKRFFKSGNPGTYGDYNTYKYESRYTFKTVGDTEVFMGSASIHDNYRLFENRYFVDQGKGLTYNSYFGTGAGTTGNAPKDGRMVGRTRFFSSSNGEIFYPSNHYIHARTSKDGLLNLIYKGTQNDGGNPTTDPIDRDPIPGTPAYIIDIGGADTLNRIIVDRPISNELRNIVLLTKSPVSGDMTFNLFKQGESILTQTLSAPFDEEKISFSQTGEASNYFFTITPADSDKAIVDVRIIGFPHQGEDVRNASITPPDRNSDGSVKVGFTAMRGDFSIRIIMDLL